MSLIPLVDLPAPGAHKLTAAELNAIFAQFVQGSQFGTAFLTWFSALPTTLPTTAGVPWNNSGTLAVS